MTQSKDPFVEVAAGDAVFREGDTGTEMYIIESGTVDIVRPSRGSTEPLATLEAGDFFGEMSVLEDQPRFASAIAREPCRLLRIDRAAFGDVVAQNVEIAIRIMRKLTARLRRSEQRAQEAHNALEEFRRKLTAKPAKADKGDKAERAARPAAAEAAPPASAPAPAPEAAPAPARAWRLRHGAQEFLLEGRSEFLVGRPDPVTGITPEVNLGPYDEGRTLSRRHAKILLDGGQLLVREDVGTTNGTYLNGERIQTGMPVALKPGDVLKFGSVDVEVVA